MTLYARFAATARRYPDRPAILGDHGTLSYAELSRAAAGIAAALDALGGAAGDRVGLLLEHGVSTVAAILGALGAGRCYVPLDPSWPRQRLAYMCSNADVSAVVTGAEHRALAAELSAAPTVLVDDLGSVVGAVAPPSVAGAAPPASSVVGAVGQPSMIAESVGGGSRSAISVDNRGDHGVSGAVGPDGPAYILYTSGSTGRPKGVVQSHRNVLHGVGNHVTNLRITPDDRISLLTSFSFDMAVTDMYSAVLSGAAVVTVDIRRHGLAHLVGALAERGVTIYHSTPTVYRYLVDALRAGGARLPELRAVVLGGEEVTRGDVLAARRHFADDCVLVNGYGATEVSFAVQYHVRPDLELPADGPVPIGYPLDGYEVLLIDGALETSGADGEIAIRSDHLALGYWRDPERTAERFVRDADGRRMYRTGDLGRLLPDGRLVYLGRRDRQVKVRGHRVELGEIEARLEALPGVARAVAVARRDAGGDTEVVGYLQPSLTVSDRPDASGLLDVGGLLDHGGRLDATAVRRALAEVLPDYLVPGAIVVCERLPLTPTGKVDVLALPEPGLAPTGRGASADPTGSGEPAASPTEPAASPTEPAASPTERVVRDAWCSVLGVPAVSLTENFFDLGGHSLLLARVQQKVEAELGVRVPLVALLEHPTVRAQAGYLDNRGETTTRGLDAVSQRMARRRASRARREDTT